MADVEQIWDLDAETVSRPPLFLPAPEDEKDDEEMPDAAKVEATFSNIDAIPDKAPAKGPQAANDLGDDQPKANDGKDKDKEGKKPKKKIARLDEGRLLGDNGFPQLIRDTKDFRIRGKGHEESDLNRLLQVYQFWTHKLYPKTPFKETTERVEKLCHSKRMRNMLGVWRDEAHGKPPPDPDADLDEDNEDNRPSESGPPSSAAPTSGVEDNLDVEEGLSSPPTNNNKDDDIDWEAMDQLAPGQPAPPPPTEIGVDTGLPPPSSIPAANKVADDEDSLWEGMENLAGLDIDYPAPAVPASRPDGDEEEWALFDEMS
ncbi:Chromosome segregation in meiosis protein [Mycena indigotica]|uniref:Chromosome segregation in meiosis protein n=1 Tax=Mycena indigotica TaxID=2126181 RepID=A0A8H6S9K7_9AGAR|nr:Chromosome segregation in meiosis protein [Mycena indigotica]KAF7294877.1 Chromosome segregation in meiosis protein [Mycena indigotica]